MDLRARVLLVVFTCVSAALLAAQQSLSDTDRNPLAGSPAAMRPGTGSFRRRVRRAMAISSRAPSLATGTFVHGGEDAEIARTIRSGVPGSQMPPFSGLTTTRSGSWSRTSAASPA